jgi:hypothetical protein
MSDVMELNPVLDMHVCFARERLFPGELGGFRSFCRFGGRQLHELSMRPAFDENFGGSKGVPRVRQTWWPIERQSGRLHLAFQHGVR